MAQAPRTRYAKCGDMDIAYQVLGDGPIDLLVLPGPIDPDRLRSTPSRRCTVSIAALRPSARVIRFDQRGIGLSSRIPRWSVDRPEFWAQDAIAVMDAVGCERATDLRARVSPR